MRKPADEIPIGSVVIHDTPRTTNPCHGIIGRKGNNICFIPTGDRTTDLYRNGPIRDRAHYQDGLVASYGPLWSQSVLVVVERPGRDR